MAFLLHRLRQLDWNTRVARTDLAAHWRAWILAVPGALLGTWLWFQHFPEGFRFLLWWSGTVTGGAAGLLLGAVWQLANDRRLPQTSARFVLGGSAAWTAFALLALLYLAPLLGAQQAEAQAFRALAAQDIVQITFRGAQGQSAIQAPEAVQAFMQHVARARPFSRSHEADTVALVLGLQASDGAFRTFAAGIPVQHPGDLAVRTGSGEMLVPQVARLLPFPSEAGAAGAGRK